MKTNFRWLRISFLIIALLCSPLAWSQPPVSLEKSTQSLINLSFMSQSKAPMSLQDIQNWTDVAKQRQALLYQMMESHTAAVVPYLLPGKITASFPKEVRPFVESEVNDIQGRLVILSALPQDKNSKKPFDVVRYVLQTKQGDSYSLRFVNTPPANLRPGITIKVKKAFLLKNLTGSKTLIVSAVDIETTIAAAKLPTALPNTLGPQNTLVMLVNFQDNPNNKPFTVDAAKTAFFTGVSNVFKDSSYNQTTLVGDAKGWFTIALNSNLSCDDVVQKLPGMADAAAKASGVNVDSYNHRVYVLPSINCGWAGLGTIGPWGDHTIAWLSGTINVGVSGHELGHNLGLYHAKLLQCTNGPIDGTCNRIEYGDLTDMMGGAAPVHFNAYQKERLGWLNFQNSPPIQTVTQTGTYNIDVYETVNKNVKALKVLRLANSDGSKEYYYVEYRQPIGADSALCTNTGDANCDFTKGVLLHSGVDILPDTSNLLDMTPGSGNTRVALLPGFTFKDTKATPGETSITLNSASATTANVTVNIASSPPPCVHQMPTVRVIPSFTQYVTPGGGYTYLVWVTNNDNEFCAPTTYSLSAQANGMVTPSIAPTVTIAPGQTAKPPLTVGTFTRTPAGTYTTTVSVVHPNFPNVSSNSNAYLGVLTNCAPTIPTVSMTPSSQSGPGGVTYRYWYTIKNNDPKNCPYSWFNFVRTSPSQFGGGSETIAAQLYAQASTSFYVTVITPVNAPRGNYVVEQTATNRDNPNIGAKTTAQLTIQ